MKILLVLCAIICLASSERYWKITNRISGMCLSSDAKFYDLMDAWHQYWKIDKEKEIDGIKFISLKNQSPFTNGGKVLDVKGDCPGKMLHLWDAHSGYPEYQMFAFLENGTVLSACKNGKGQFQLIHASHLDIVKSEPDANVPASLRNIDLVPYDY